MFQYYRNLKKLIPLAGKEEVKKIRLQRQDRIRSPVLLKSTN